MRYTLSQRSGQSCLSPCLHQRPAACTTQMAWKSHIATWTPVSSLTTPRRGRTMYGSAHRWIATLRGNYKWAIVWTCVIFLAKCITMRLSRSLSSRLGDHYLTDIIFIYCSPAQPLLNISYVAIDGVTGLPSAETAYLQVVVTVNSTIFLHRLFCVLALIVCV